jgi:FkbM family methyltransferase
MSSIHGEFLNYFKTLRNILSSIFRRVSKYGLKTSLYYLRSEIIMIFRGNIFNTYSQLGEDRVLDSLLGCKGDGFYVDVGTNDPKRFNNTMRFYKKGWRGINIEPDPRVFKKIVRNRPQDINLNIGISKKPSSLPFFIFDPDTLSTFSQDSADVYVKEGFLLREVLNINTETLSQVLMKYASGIPIDFISVDTEGYDLEVLQSCDLLSTRPTLICVETERQSSVSSEGLNIEAYLISMRYKKVYDNGLNSIYKAF